MQMEQIEQLRDHIVSALEDMKGDNIRVLDVHKQTAITDFMIVASGTSDRHVKGLANAVQTAASEQGVKSIGVEGDGECEWVLVDLRDIVVHIMLPRVRDFYNLEKLWQVDGEVSEETESVLQSKLKR